MVWPTLPPTTSPAAEPVPEIVLPAAPVPVWITEPTVPAGLAGPPVGPGGLGTVTVTGDVTGVPGAVTVTPWLPLAVTVTPPSLTPTPAGGPPDTPLLVAPVPTPADSEPLPEPVGAAGRAEPNSPVAP